jgi:hypothetical protein
MTFRSLLSQSLRFALARHGKYLFDRRQLGHDAFGDIQRFGRLWGYPVEIFWDVGANDGDTIRRAELFSGLPNYRV